MAVFEEVSLFQLAITNLQRFNLRRAEISSGGSPRELDSLYNLYYVSSSALWTYHAAERPD